MAKVYIPQKITSVPSVFKYFVFCIYEDILDKARTMIYKYKYTYIYIPTTTPNPYPHPHTKLFETSQIQLPFPWCDFPGPSVQASGSVT